jgi:hypothetical protein
MTEYRDYWRELRVIIEELRKVKLFRKTNLNESISKLKALSHEFM